MRMNLEKSRFHLLPFRPKIVEVFSPAPFVIVWKSIWKDL